MTSSDWQEHHIPQTSLREGCHTQRASYAFPNTRQQSHYTIGPNSRPTFRTTYDAQPQSRRRQTQQFGQHLVKTSSPYEFSEMASTAASSDEPPNIAHTDTRSTGPSSEDYRRHGKLIGRVPILTSKAMPCPTTHSEQLEHGGSDVTQKLDHFDVSAQTQTFQSSDSRVHQQSNPSDSDKCKLQYHLFQTRAARHLRQHIRQTSEHIYQPDIVQQRSELRQS